MVLLITTAVTATMDIRLRIESCSRSCSIIPQDSSTSGKFPRHGQSNSYAHNGPTGLFFFYPVERNRQQDNNTFGRALVRRWHVQDIHQVDDDGHD